MSVLAMVILFQLGPRPAWQRLDQLSGTEEATAEEPGVPAWIHRVVKLSGPLARLSLPAEGWEKSRLRIRFMNAGYRTSSAPVLFFAAKTLLTLALPGLLVL